MPLLWVWVVAMATMGERLLLRVVMSVMGSNGMSAGMVGFFFHLEVISIRIT